MNSFPTPEARLPELLHPREAGWALPRVPPERYASGPTPAEQQVQGSLHQAQPRRALSTLHLPALAPIHYGFDHARLYLSAGAGGEDLQPRFPPTATANLQYLLRIVQQAHRRLAQKLSPARKPSPLHCRKMQAATVPELLRPHRSQVLFCDASGGRASICA